MRKPRFILRSLPLTRKNIMNKRHFLKLAAALALAASLPAQAVADSEAAADLNKRLAEHGTIVAGTEGIYPPFSYHDENGRLTGYDVEVARAAAAKLGVKIEFKETQWDAMMAGLNSRRFDFVANQMGMTTEERRAKYQTTQPYSVSGPVVVTRKEDNRLQSWQDIKGMHAVQVFNSNYADFAKEFGADITSVDSLAQCIPLIAQKRADLTINDRLAILDFFKKHPDAPLKIALQPQADQKIPVGFVFVKGNDKAVAQFDQAIAELRADGTLKKLSEQFFGEDISQ